MKKMLSLLSTILITSTLMASEYKTGEELSRDLELSPKKKVSMQWKRVFENKRKMHRYGIDQLTQKEKSLLKTYLIENAVDVNRQEI